MSLQERKMVESAQNSIQFAVGLNPTALLLRMYLDGGGSTVCVNNESPVEDDAKFVDAAIWRLGRIMKTLRRNSNSSISVAWISKLFVMTSKTLFEESLSSHWKSTIRSWSNWSWSTCKGICIWECRYDFFLLCISRKQKKLGKRTYKPKKNYLWISKTDRQVRLKYQSRNISIRIHGKTY
jgi:hypothetical protein